VKLIIDTDPGVDDAMAIFYAALVPEIELLGLTCIFGNVPVETATRNALHLLEMAGLELPVAKGADKALARSFNPPSCDVHGVEGFGHIPAQSPIGAAVEETAPEFLCRMAREHKGELVICPIGPITNIADAIQLDPDFVSNVKKIVFMGGAAFRPGNVTAFAEANTFNDPHALNVVINSGADCLMVGLDVTMSVLLKEHDFAALAESSPKLGGFLEQASKFYLNFYREVPKIDGCGLHDPMAVIACTHPEMFEIERHPIQVVELGEAIGQTVVTTDPDSQKIGICVGGDIEAVKQRFLSAFA